MRLIRKSLRIRDIAVLFMCVIQAAIGNRVA